MQADVVRQALLALLVEKLPDGFPVFPGPPAEDQPLAEAVWIDADQSDYTFEWLGPAKPKEDIGIDLVIEVYRESDDQQNAQAAARDRATYIERAITEDAVGDTYDLQQTTNWALVKSARREPVPAPKGWAWRITLHIDATAYPDCH